MICLPHQGLVELNQLGFLHSWQHLILKGFSSLRDELRDERACLVDQVGQEDLEWMKQAEGPGFSLVERSQEVKI